ncbi:DUF3102 domain-containing protein [Tepidibacter hydrothermalis]|uniref:DUF3102 domain-containing protein n=1 Tax=Tepidibacter hydrothermalis TaxID=3036126 RepID=A0ABY8EGB0_9FIRM|nr:DUF3102 domain-containing protein [Tepidibacter hydrothermalis]WFD11994.1 DUF3102 domain-containing protein [Tepidibacter hydrothermalis]
MNEMITRTPNIIATEINNIKEQTRKMVLYNSIEIGRRLIEAKQLIEHGKWGEWLKKSVDYSQSTANNLMRIFKEYGSEQITLLGDNSKSQAFGNLSYTQAVALLGISEEDREDFVKDNDIDNTSTRQLQQAIKEKKALEKKLKTVSSEAQENKELYDTVSESYKKLEKTNSEHYKKAKKLKKELEEMQEKLSEAEASGNNEEVEKLPEDIERELQELREKVKQNPQSTDESITKFKVHFEKTVGSMKELLQSLAEIKKSNEDEHEKYKKAVSGLINKMLETL